MKTAQIVRFPQCANAANREASLEEQLDAMLQALTPTERAMIRDLFGILGQLRECRRGREEACV